MPDTEVIGPGRGLADPSFRMAVSRGHIEGWTSYRKYGRVDLDNVTPMRDCWEFGGVSFGDLDYTYPADGTAPITHFSSSSALDTGPILIEGCDINGVLVQQIPNIVGQTKTALTTPLWRCFRAFYLESAASFVIGTTGLQGDFYVYTDSAVVAGVPADAEVRTYIGAGQNQTLQAFSTVPADQTGFLVWARSAIEKRGAASITIEAWVRGFGMAPRLADSGSLSATGTSVFEETGILIQSIPEKTDIIIRAQADTPDTSYAARYDIFLADNDRL